MRTLLLFSKREGLSKPNLAMLFRSLLLILCLQAQEQSMGAQTVKGDLHTIISAHQKETCYEQFSMARQLPEAAYPPEIRFFCAAPWNIAALASVKIALEQVGFDFIEATLKAAPVANRVELRERMRFDFGAALSGPPGLSEAFYSYRVLPFLNGLMKANPKVVAVIEKSFDSVDVAKMRRALAIVDWSQSAFDLRAAAMMFTVAVGNENQRDIELYIAPDPNIKLADLAASLLFSAMAPADLMENSHPFGAIYAPWFKSFLPFKLSAQLGMLSGNVAFSLARSRSIGESAVSTLKCNAI